MSPPQRRLAEGWWWVPVALGLLALHFACLEGLPNPAGDEANWALLGLGAARGQPIALPPEARFVSTLFAYAIGCSFRLVGPSWGAARLVPALAVVLGAALCGALLATAGRRREGALLALLVVLHPWSVAWGRTVSVPYALPYALGIVAAVALWRASRASTRPRAFGWCVLAAQALGLALQGSPLALTAVAAAGATLAREPAWRRPWATPEGALAGMLGALHALPLAHSLGAARRATAPLAPPTEALWERAASYANGALGALSGESTVRHFAGSDRAAWALTTVSVLALIAVALPGTDALGRHARRWLGLSVVLLPALLAPGRAWHLPTVDSDRYGFVLAAPGALAVACASRGPRGRAAVALALLLWGAGSLRLAWHFTLGGGPDLGLSAWNGGRYRGWQPLDTHRPLPDTLREEVLRDAHGAPAAVTYTDYAFHALRFTIAAAGDQRVTHHFASPAPVPGRRTYQVAWEGSLEPGITIRNIKVFRHPDGSPWCVLRALGEP